MDRLKEGMLQLTKGWDRGQVERLVQDVMLDVIDPYVYQEALDLIAEHQAAGRRIYIVSSSPEEVVRPLARHFGVSGVIATRAQVGPDNRYTGELEFYAYGQQKADAIRALADRDDIDLAGCYAYTDSITDVPMLEAVGQPRRRERRPGTAARRRGARVGDPRLPQPGTAAFADRRGGAAQARRRRRGSRRGRGGGRRAGVGLAAARDRRAHPPRSDWRGRATGCSVEWDAERRPRGEQNPRVSHAAGGMSQDPGRMNPAPGTRADSA